jgi:hypothetical protein
MATDSGLSYLSGLLRTGARPFGSPGRAPRSRATMRPNMFAPDAPSGPSDISDHAEAFDAAGDPSREDAPAHQPSQWADATLASRPKDFDLSDAPQLEMSHTESGPHEGILPASPSRDEAGVEPSPPEQGQYEASSDFERVASATSTRGQEPFTPQRLTTEALSEKAAHFTADAGASDDQGRERDASLPSSARPSRLEVGQSRNVFSRHDAPAHEVETESHHSTPANAYTGAAEGGATQGVEMLFTESLEGVGRDSEAYASPEPEGRASEIIARGAGLLSHPRHTEIGVETNSATASTASTDESARTFNRTELSDAARASAASPIEAAALTVSRAQVIPRTGGASAESRTASHDEAEAPASSAAHAAVLADAAVSSADAAASWSNKGVQLERESAFRVPPARDTQEPPTLPFNAQPKPSAPAWPAGDLQPADESVMTRAGEGGAVAADPTPYTLEAHIAELRSLMRSKRAQTPGDAGKEAAADVRRQAAVVVIGETRPARTLSAQEASGVATPSESASGARDTSLQAAARQPNAPSVAAASDAASNAGAPDAHLRDANRSPATAQPKAVQPPPEPPRVRASALQERAGVRAGEVPQVKAGAPKLTIKRLDVRIVEQDAPRPPPPPPPQPPARSRPDPWGALDRHFLGHVF